MGYYHLTEAYSDLYNPRKIEENRMFYDNLRFVDYLTQEHIQEVAESIIWEFMDYGSTFDESCEIMMESLSDDGVEGFLTEAAVTYGHDTRQPREVTMGAGRQSYGPFRGGDTRAQLRRQERVERIKGGVKSAIGAVKGAAKTAGSAVGGAVSSTVKTAKAALKGLLRGGAKAALRAGRDIERSGKAAERTTAVYGPGYGRGGSTEPISTRTSGGAKRRAIGGALKSVGKFISKATRGTREVAQSTQAPSQPLPQRLLPAARQSTPIMPRPSAVAEPAGSLARRSTSRGDGRSSGQLRLPGSSISTQRLLPAGPERPRFRVVGTKPSGEAAPSRPTIRVGGTRPSQALANTPRLPAAGGTTGSRPTPTMSAGQRRAIQREIRAQQKEAEAAQKAAARETAAQTRETNRRRSRATEKLEAAASGDIPSASYGRGRTLPSAGGGSRTRSGNLRPEGSRRRALARAARATGGSSDETQALRSYTAARSAAQARSLPEDFEYIISMIIENLIDNGYANSYESAAIILENLSDDMYQNLIEQYID